TIHSSTVTQNTAAVGGGLYNDSSLVSATVTLKNTILAGNSSTEGSDSDLSGAGVSSGNNIIGDLAGGIGFSNGVSADQVGGQVSFSLSDATSDEPIEITASAHNLVTGDRVRITGVVGNVAANGVFSVTVVDALRFTLDGSTGAGNYASGGDVFRLIDPRLGQPPDNLPNLPTAMNSGSVSYFPQPMIPPITAVRTETHLPLSGSPAIDAGNNTGAPATDQRGLARPVDGDGDQMDVVDIGAVELFYGSVSGSVFDDLNGNGIRDSGEPGLAGASVYHDANENGFPDSDELVVQTAIDDEATSGVDEAGTFTFVQLPPGSQIIRQIQDVAFRLTTPTATVFSAPVSLTPVTGPGASVLVDVNNDGNLDVVVLRDSNDLQVGLSDDQGMLASFTTHAVGINPVAVTATDLNADGQPDLVVANRNSNDLSILLNTGSGQFGPASSVVAGMTPEAVVSGEFTGDTNPDIAVVNGGSDSVMILAGNGMGGFSSTVSVAVGSTPVDLVALDFNGDQLIDLVTVNSGDNTVSLIKNNGAGMFAAAVSFTAGSQPVAIAGGDVNQDGFDDIAIATAADDVLIRFSTGASFDPELMLGSVDSPSDIALLDGDGDTFPGIAVTSASSGTVTVFENSRGMLTAGGVFPTGGAPGSIAVADGNSDGLDDFITSNAGSGDVTRLINLHGSAVVNVQTGITTAGAEFGNLLSGSISGTKFHDLDQDGNQDPGEPGLSGFGIYIDQNQNNQLDQSEPSVVTGVDGTFTFTGVEAGVPLTLREIQQSGFVQTTPKELTLRSIGDLNLAGGQRAFSSGDLIASGDLNGDGERDSVIVNPGIDSVSVVEFHMGSAPVRVDIPVGISPRSVHLADVNADGHLDILTANNGSGNVSVILNNGDGSYSAASQFSAGATPQDLTTADFNGDSSPDIAVSNSLTGDVQILINTGSGSFAAPVSITLSTATSGEAIEAGDFDGDGNADLVVLSEDLFGVVVLRNLGGTQFEELDAVAVGMFPTGAATGDLDGDSDLDLVVTNTADGTVQFLLNDSNGVFTPGAPFSVGGAPGAVTLSDLDGDGHLDAVVANQTLPDVTVLLGDGAGGVDSSLAVDAGGGQDGVGVVSIPANGQPGFVATKFMAGTLA
ncbi:MAG: FG-GAP-like repeat-containing protein, partial [Planctomycetaceae bacterium]